MTLPVAPLAETMKERKHKDGEERAPLTVECCFVFLVFFVCFFRCFSTTGKSGGKQLLSLGKGCRRKGVVIHELLHALGMMHEHCRADRDQFIRINFENIKPSKCSWSIRCSY